MLKLAMGFCNTTLCFFFGEPCQQQIADIYHHTIALLDAKAEGILHGVNVMEQWVEHFPTLVSIIERKLGEEAYGGLLFLQESVYSGYAKCIP
jgi:hypothetical protein